MKFLLKILNPFWFSQDLTLNMGAKESGAMSGAASGAMAGASLGPWGALAGGVIGGLGGFFGSEEEVVPPSASDLARETADIQENIYLPSLMRQRDKFNPQMMGHALDQARLAQSGLQGFGSGISRDINQQRNIFSDNSIQQLRQQSPGFAGSERLQQMMQQQAEQGLRTGGNLNPEQMRGIDQMTQGAVASRGRGAGAFGVGQMALGRHSVLQANEDRARNFAQQTQQGGLNVSNPLQKIFAQSASTTGSFMDRLRNIQGFGASNSVSEFDPIGAGVLSANGMNSTLASNFNQRQSARSDDMFGGAMSSLGNMDFGSMFGGGGGGSMVGGGTGQRFGNIA